jgi:hypothetical protein
MENELVTVTIEDVDCNRLFELTEAFYKFASEHYRDDLMPLYDFLIAIVDEYGDIVAEDIDLESEEE